jgi:phosphotransferase system enzyme I (PtsI)
VTGKQQEFDGLGISAGIGIGVVHVHESGAVAVPEYRVPAAKVGAEQARLKRAVTLARRQIGRLRTKSQSMPADAAQELGFLMDAYSQMLKNSRLVRGAHRRIAENRINAEAAVHAEIAEIAKSFEAMEDAYIAARLNDIRGIANRLMRNLTKTPIKPFSLLPKGSIIVAEELTPADTAQLNPDRVAGIATALGGAEGHTAIMARALGLPAVMGLSGFLGQVRADDPIVVDGDTGRVIVNPKKATLDLYRRRKAERQDTLRRLAGLRRQPAVTRDDTRITLQANVELPMEMKMVAQSGAEGIGLLRSEFLFMNRDDIPGEDEQHQALSNLIAPMDGRPVTVRTLDVGGEKTAAALMGDFGASVSSALGMRGIRLSLARTDVFEVQLRAILRAAADHDNVRVLLPMVSTVTEVRRARVLMVRSARRLKRRGVPVPDPLPPLGVMIEVPGAALAADALARASDFFAIGSNDLTMYTLAIDRRDEQVAHLYDPLHPAVLRLIQFATEAGLRARIPVSICGEMAGDPRFTALLLGLGLRELSMNAASIPVVKQRIRDMDLIAADQRARIIMDQVDPGRIATLLDDFNGLA